MKRLLATAAALLCLASPAMAGDIAFWDTPQYGGNSFNGKAPDEAYFRALKATGATWVRLTWSKWKGEGQDFLIGDADGYTGIPASDLQTLIKTMDAAQAAGIKVVLVPLGLPGDRWNQQNGGNQDERLWNDRAYWDQSAAFWRDLATAVKDHPALAGYNLLNEPTPEKGMDLAEDAAADARITWYAKYKGTTHDLPALYEHIITAIREVDPNTPVMVDGGWYANAGSFAYWTPLKDDKVLYTFHMYEPWNLTSSPQIKRNPQWPYPGPSWPGGETFDRKAMEAFLAQPFDWAKANGVPVNRMVAGEYGCVRVWKDCGAYLNDVLDILNSHGSHWAFYSFREDVWEAMDYEIPPEFPAARFYYLMDHGKAADIPRNGPLMTVIRDHMK